MTEPETRHLLTHRDRATSRKTNRKLLQESRELLTFGTWHYFSISQNKEILISCNKDFIKWFFSLPQTILLVNIYPSQLVEQVSFKSLSTLSLSQLTCLQEYLECYSFDGITHRAAWRWRSWPSPWWQCISKLGFILPMKGLFHISASKWKLEIMLRCQSNNFSLFCVILIFSISEKQLRNWGFYCWIVLKFSVGYKLESLMWELR